MSYYVYVLKSTSHGNFYYGSTHDIESRIKAHNSGRVRYTKGRRPWVRHYFEAIMTRSEAVLRERFFKTVDGYQYLQGKRIIGPETVSRVLPKASLNDALGQASLRENPALSVGWNLP